MVKETKGLAGHAWGAGSSVSVGQKGKTILEHRSPVTGALVGSNGFTSKPMMQNSPEEFLLIQRLVPNLGII